MTFKRIYNRVTSFIMAVVLMFTGVLVCYVGADAHGAETKHSTEWMLDIPDDTKVSSITIPGTHCSGAKYIFPGYLFKCQSDDIPTQMVNGYRFFDLHLAMHTDKKGNKRLKFVNKGWDCRTSMRWFSKKLYLDDVLEKVYAFLEAHPSETLIFCVTKASDKDDVNAFRDLLYEQINASKDFWYLKNRIPTLGEVRGKIILARTYQDAANKSDNGLNFVWAPQDSDEVPPLPYEANPINSVSTLWVQDRHRFNIENKINAYRDTLSDAQADDDNFVLNFLSTESNGFFPHPKHYAKYINEDFLENQLSYNTSYGVIVVDFGTKEIAKFIYNSNFAEIKG